MHHEAHAFVMESDEKLTRRIPPASELRFFRLWKLRLVVGPNNAPAVPGTPCHVCPRAHLIVKCWCVL